MPLRQAQRHLLAPAGQLPPLVCAKGFHKGELGSQLLALMHRDRSQRAVGPAAALARALRPAPLQNWAFLWLLATIMTSSDQQPHRGNAHEGQYRSDRSGRTGRSVFFLLTNQPCWVRCQPAPLLLRVGLVALIAEQVACAMEPFATCRSTTSQPI